MYKLRLNRPIFAAIHDLIMAAASFVLSLYLRLGDATMQQSRDFIVEGTVLFTVVCGVVFWRVRLYRCLWRYASLNDLWALTKGVTFAILIFVPLFFAATRLEGFPRSAMVINWFVLLALLGGPRFIYRLIKDGGFRPLTLAEDRRIPVLLVGAGDAAELFIREMARSATWADYQVVGVVDNRPDVIGGQIHGVRVFGRLDEIPETVDKLERRGSKPQRLILTERFDGETVRRMLDIADGQGMTLARLPRLTDFRSGDGDEPIEVRPVAVEDLLGRPQTVLDRDSMRGFIAGRRILVTGAGGTIGSELVRQIAAFEPAHLTLFDNAEYNLYLIDGELAAGHPAIPRRAVLGDVRDRGRIDVVLARERPEVVFHAAAFKHVPMVEANPNEGVLTNVVGTRNLVDGCRAAGVHAMVLISTDKAVNPTSVMGATKRIAELCCQAHGATLGRGDTRFVTVRFGNVLGSTGSVVPLFRRQLIAGEPLTVTHPEMTRYFMTVREAVELVLEASAVGGGEDGHGGEIFVLEMGEPVRILDLARQMIRLAGLRPDVDVEIVYTGIRPGEKLYEELFYASESLVPTGRDGILLARSTPADLQLLLGGIDDLRVAAERRRTSETEALIRRLVPEYRPLGEAERATAGD
ncbi:MAG: nucleoside-diphosphate sugar epimerase/dehydratase [Alphaproteobacteria bacterium]